jgi:Na+/H+ antiporter NhaD/arsenite permease-like protein
MDWIKPAIASGIFLAVIAIVLFDWIHLTIVSLLGAIVLVFLRIISVEDAVQSVSENYSTFVLLFGVMVIVRSLELPVTLLPQGLQNKTIDVLPLSSF